MADAVARPLRHAGLRADHRHPGAELTFEPRLEVERIGLDAEKPAAEQLQRVTGGALRDRLAFRRADVLDRMIDGADAGRQKQPFRGVHSGARIEDYALRHHEWMPEALLDVARSVGAAGRRGVFAGR